jgi:hypothetical protein
VEPNIETKVRTREADASYNQSECDFADPVQQTEWLALLELQKRLEAMSCDQDDRDSPITSN